MNTCMIQTAGTEYNCCSQMAVNLGTVVSANSAFFLHLFIPQLCLVKTHLLLILNIHVGRDSSVGIATRY